MCSSKSNLHHKAISIARINGRPVLQQACNQINSFPNRRCPPKKASLKSPPPAPEPKSTVLVSPPISPKTRPLRSPVPKRGINDPNGLSSSSDKVSTPKGSLHSANPGRTLKKSMSRALSLPTNSSEINSLKCSIPLASALAEAAAGSIAAARKEQVAMQQEQRKMKIAHYGRVKSLKSESKVVSLDHSALTAATTSRDDKRCSFITANSDPILVAYHDEEWGVPVRDDRLLFELLVLTGAQVGSDWSSVLKKRQLFRDVFSGFDADAVAKFTEKKIIWLSTAYGIESGLIRAAVDSSRCILEVTKEFGTFSEYLWGFVNKKPIATQYKRCQKIPVKTSKAESISKDLVKRGFRAVGPIVIHSFMQAAGLTNDHLITCPRHAQCSLWASPELKKAHQELI
ncbi:uncharacterized protein LOC116204849 [Punica granatum]|uniref:DNA-3-methyladenine glycosylase I n=2 Tax=Punica granatum TaxID=22663 RepID=A0A218XI43_PUNGR|nr:uncharacterized protein LOC116204849 [Punica granatum]XP_031393042.1 uncharacterized protein LOC116204849 [Punica granatum]OWM84440.1 hypothetical protein CDL15_Pgr026448 [Punica granatum]PKI58403.1 hypothetical protein CRG98_021221 [Punica granatum]